MFEEKIATASEPVIEKEVEKEEVAPSGPSNAPNRAVEEPEKVEPQEPAYTPNRKYKVFDQEKEFDEWVTPYLSKENETKFRELFEKATAIDHVKAKRDEERQARQTIEQNLQGLQREVAEVMMWRDKDIGTFIEKTGLTKQKVAQWLVAELEKENLPPEQKAIYNERERLMRENWEREKQIEALSSSHMDSAVQARTTELHSVLDSPTIKPLVDAFDSRLGRPGAFAATVIRHGKAEWDSSQGKRDLRPQEAVREVLNILGLSEAASPAATPNQPATTKVVTAAKPTVIPNVGSGSQSPAGKRPKSIDDLRALAKEMAQSAG